MIKCEIKRYDEGVTSPPYTSHQIGELEIHDFMDNCDVWIALVKKCKELGYTFRFFSMSDKEEYKYSVMVK